jgi:hypothetical protein
MQSIAAEVVSAEPLHVDLGPSWDFDSDVIVLAGAGAAPTLDHLIGSGHHRLIHYLPAESRERVDGRVRTVRSSSELWAALLGLKPPPRTITLRRVPGGGLSSEMHRDLAKTIQELVVNRATFATKGETWVRNSLRNMRYMVERPSIATLTGKFAKKPCVIVSAGPSLAKNIDGLHALKGRALIIAGNRSVAPLKQAGIAPDLVIVADPIDLRYQLQGGLLDGAGALLLDLVVHPGMFDDLEARRHFTYTSVHEVFNSTFGALEQGGLLASGGSVATTSMQLALELGCDPVIFVGQDLAVSGDRYYIETALDGATRVSVKDGVGVFENWSPELMHAVQELHGDLPDSRKPVQPFLSVRGWDGNPISTSFQFNNYRRWLESKVRSLDGGTRVLNCTEGGAFIEHMEHMTLAEATASLTPEPLDVDAVLDGVLAGFDRKKQRKSVEGQVARMQKALNTAVAEVESCERLLKQLRTKPTAFKNLDKVEKRLRAALAQAPFITAWSNLEVEAAQRMCANAKSLEDTVSASRTLYSVIRKSAHAARPLLSETQDYVRGSGS